MPAMELMAAMGLAGMEAPRLPHRGDGHGVIGCTSLMVEILLVGPDTNDSGPWHMTNDAVVSKFPTCVILCLYCLCSIPSPCLRNLFGDAGFVFDFSSLSVYFRAHGSFVFRFASTCLSLGFLYEDGRGHWGKQTECFTLYLFCLTS